MPRMGLWAPWDRLFSSGGSRLHPNPTGALLGMFAVSVTHKLVHVPFGSLASLPLPGAGRDSTCREWRILRVGRYARGINFCVQNRIEKAGPAELAQNL
jgi:hypothetical protein